MGLRRELKKAPLRRVMHAVAVLLSCGHELRIEPGRGHGYRARCIKCVTPETP